MGKAKPNAFYYYMQERKRQFESQGKKYSMQQMPELVHNDWKNLPQAKKDHYQELCKKMKGCNKLTSDGIPLELSELDRIQKIERDMSMKKEIENYVGSLVQNNHIINELFFIINVNEYCYYASKECYIPAEIGISCFNLSKGVINHYHVILNPGNLPIGYKGTASRFAEETHRLPIPPEAIGEVNYELVITDIINFLSQGSSDGNDIGVMFALGDENRSDNKNFVKVNSVMADLAVGNGLSESKFKIYPLTYLFYYLNKLIGDTSTFPSTSLVLSEIEKDIYAYENGIACETHQNNEAINWCALSKSIRYSYAFLEHFCPYFGISLKVGCHIPESAKLKNQSRDTSDTMSTYSRSSNTYSVKSEMKSVASSANTYAYADDEDDMDTSTARAIYQSDESDYEV